MFAVTLTRTTVGLEHRCRQARRLYSYKNILPFEGFAFEHQHHWSTVSTDNAEFHYFNSKGR